MNGRFISAILLVASIGIFLGYVSPTWNGSIAQTKAAIATDDKALAAANQYTARQNELASERNAISPDDLARLTTFLPDSVDNVGMILDLDALAARSGLSLSNIDVSTNESVATAATTGALPAGGISPVGSVDLSLSAVGTYTALQDFLDGVEKSQRLLDVLDLAVKGSDTGVYTYQMKLRLYWLR